VDLLDWHRGALSSRRLTVLLKHLPADSALAHALHGEESEWTVTDHLLAAAVDHLAISNWMFSAVYRDEDAEMPEVPTPVPRPGVESADDEPGRAREDSGPTRHEFALFFSG
jgi:hypothetical protein